MEIVKLFVVITKAFDKTFGFHWSFYSL